MQQITVEENSGVASTIASKNLLQEDNAKNKVTIPSRFGKIAVQPEKAISFPHGIPGIPGALDFCLTDLPNIKNKQFKLLQSLNDYSLSFIVVPATYDNQLIDEKDIEEACKILGITKNNLLLLFIVTVHETPAGRKMSVNAKAPVFIDAANKTANQYIFQHNKYAIQHFV